jgi:hypothetical protein
VNERGFLFEDDALLGFVHVSESADAIIDGWRALQDHFLRRNARNLTASGKKSWNLYSVFLTESPATSQQQHFLLRIEEDFTSTRKVARAGLVAVSDVCAALLPLIPLQRAVALPQDYSTAKLRELLQPVFPGQTLEAFLSDDQPLTAAEALLSERSTPK